MAYAEKRGKDKHNRTRWRGRYKLPNGDWGSVSRDDNGQPFYTRSSARDYATGLETDVRRKTFINPRHGRTTVGEWAEAWIESIDVGNRSDKTYRQRLRTVILPEWQHVPVADITTVAYSTWEKRLRAKYSHEYVKSVTSVFRVMLDDAVASRLIGANPVPTRSSQRRGKYKGRQREDTTVVATPRQALLVARNALELRGLTGYVMMLTIAYAGLRISEAAGLRRENVVLEDDGSGPRLLVLEQHQYVDGRPAQVPPKYGSTGSLILPPFLAGILGELLASHESEWVFPSTRGGKTLLGTSWYALTWRPVVDGKPPVYDRLGRRSPAPALRAVAGLDGMKPHELRHSMKVWLDERKHPRVAVEGRMRHVVPGVEGTYSHVTLAMEKDVAADLQELWEESLRVVVDRREWEAPRWDPTKPASRETVSQKSPNHGIGRGIMPAQRSPLLVGNRE